MCELLKENKRYYNAVRSIEAAKCSEFRCSPDYRWLYTFCSSKIVQSGLHGLNIPPKSMINQATDRTLSFWTPDVICRM